LITFAEIEWWEGRGVAAAQAKVAHFAFYAAVIRSMASGNDTLLKNLVENGIMKYSLLPKADNHRPSAAIHRRKTSFNPMR
jgi:hypothetical protein